jgi:hypothetical protein
MTVDASGAEPRLIVYDSRAARAFAYALDAGSNALTAEASFNIGVGWDIVWCDVRCGLKSLDNVFLMFTGLSLFALVGSSASIFVNVYLRHHATRGSIRLAVGTMFFIPWSAFWIFVPYFSTFPRALPADFKPTKTPCDPPDPWPFGSQLLAWTLIVIRSSGTVPDVETAHTILEHPSHNPVCSIQAFSHNQPCQVVNSCLVKKGPPPG